jgi:Urease accessory protein UreF
MEKGTRLLAYVQLLDSALPIGSFSHSFGLETYVQEGRITNRPQLAAFIESQLHSNLTRVEGLAIKGCYLALREGNLDKVARLDSIVQAQRLARESREGLQKMGRRLFKLATTLHPWMDFDKLKDALERHHSSGTLPIIHAYINYHLEIDLNDAVTGYLYSSVNMMVGSALRLMSLGQTEGQAILTSMFPVIEREWNAVSHMDPEQMHSFSFAQEIAAMNHETLYSRLFMS